MWHLEPSYNFSYEVEELQKEEPLHVQDWALVGSPAWLHIGSWWVQQLLVQKGWAEPPVILLGRMSGLVSSAGVEERLSVSRKISVRGFFSCWNLPQLQYVPCLVHFITLNPACSFCSQPSWSALTYNMLSYWVMIISLCCLTFPDSLRLFWRAQMPAELPGDLVLSKDCFFFSSNHLFNQTPFPMW